MKNIFLFLFIYTYSNDFVFANSNDNYSELRYDSDDFFVLVGKNETKNIIVLRGFLPIAADLNPVKDLIKSIDPSKKVILDLSGFNGGSVVKTKEYLNLIVTVCNKQIVNRGNLNNCDLVTFVGSDAPCVSACIIPFMYAKERVVCNDSEFGFHSLKKDFFFGFTYLLDSRESVVLLTGLGINEEWALRREEEGMFSQDKVTHLNSLDMEGSNIFTRVVESCNSFDLDS